jgi:Mg-chelatase subunit ChlD
MSIPAEFLCPISMDFMTEPVMGSDGHTYELSAIREWLTKNSVSPLTRKPMTLDDVHPNFALRTAIERWKLSNESSPFVPEIPAFGDSKTIVVSGRYKDDTMVLDISVNNSKPLESILISVLDVSGSMGYPASQKTENEGSQFSRLDLVKHSMKTLAKLLHSEYPAIQSSMGIISFSDSAGLVMPITKMDDVGLRTVNTSIDNLRNDGGTNIWDGLRLALIQASAAIERNPNANVQVLLLTDGEPTPALLPPIGIKSTLKRKLDSVKGRLTISTFGFGYELDSDLLESICILGNGTYGYIPDCSMVGTVFINWAAKALLTRAHHITIKLPDFSQYNIGDLIVGQTQHLVLPHRDITHVDITYDNCLTTKVPVKMKEGNITNEVYLQKVVHEIGKIKNSTSYFSIRPNALLELKAHINSLPEQTELLRDIVSDIESTKEDEGQIMKACSSNDWWESWGKNHCIAYYHALKLQQCINFKDKVLQHFVTDEFKAFQEKGIDIFSSLPSPVPSFTENRHMNMRINTTAPHAPNQNRRLYAPNPTVPLSMGFFVNRSGPCFTGGCLILMEDIRIKYVKTIKKGDIVWGGHKVKAVLYTPVNHEIDMIKFNSGLQITPWHPIKMSDNSEWVFPNDVGTKCKIYVDGLYNVVLETGHIIELNGYKVATLGHGFTDNNVIKHPYFGTNLVVQDLMKHPDWESGFLIMDSKNIVRNEETGLIEKIQ